MTKLEVATIVAQTTGQDLADVMNVYEKILEVISKSVIAGEPVFMRGFGTLGTKVRAEKKARNISKGVSVMVPSKVVPFFKPSPDFAGKVSRAHQKTKAA